MKKAITGLVALTRFDDYVCFVIITTLLGVAAAKGGSNWRLIILLSANWLVVGFAFMIQNIEDAPDDALSDSKIHRNPLSKGLISPTTARIAAFMAALISLVFLLVLGKWPLIFGLVTLALGYFYSYRGVRLKAVGMIDLLTYALIFAGLPFLIGYFTFASKVSDNWFWPFIFVLSISIYGKLLDENRRIDGDQSELAHHKAYYLGKRASHFLMITMLLISVFSGAASLILVELIPLWALILMAILAGLFILLSMIKTNETSGVPTVQTIIHKPLERAVALALVLQYLIPWVGQFLKPGIF